MQFPVLILLIELSIFCAAQDDDNKVTVDVPDYGNVVGELMVYEPESSYIRFFDVPYGIIEENGWFVPAKPAPPTRGFVNEEVQPECPGVDTFIDEEDDAPYRSCLVLKIDTRSIKTKSPVMVYIPGFDLVSGSTGTTNGRHLMTQEVVLVTVQYRVGAFGFLSTITDEIPGNMALHDIILSIEWINKHISHFGGDPNCVTLFGQYKAAELISALLATNVSNSLFHRAIYHSPGTINDFAVAEDKILETAKIFAKGLGCEKFDTSEQLNDCFHRTKFGDFVNIYGELVLQKKLLPQVLMPSNFELTQLNGVPCLTGVVANGGIYYIDHYFNKNNYSKFSLRGLSESITSESTDLTLDILSTPENQTLKNVEESTLKQLAKRYWPQKIDKMNAALYYEQSDHLKAIFSSGKEVLPQNSYAYVFNYKSDIHFLSPKYENMLRNYATLLDDYRYLLSDDSFEGDDDKICKIMVELWTSFASNGVPVSKYVDDWKPVINGTGLIIDLEPKVVNIDELKEAVVHSTENCSEKPDCKWIDVD